MFLSDTDADSGSDVDQEYSSSEEIATRPATTYRVDTKKSPRFKTYLQSHPVTLTLDTGAETNMVKASLAHYLSIKVKKSTQSARQADETTPLEITGETSLTVSRRGIDMRLEALIVSNMDVDILAGTPFMASNDIAGVVLKGSSQGERGHLL